MPMILMLTSMLTVILLRWLVPIAVSLNLVDLPTRRKRHMGAVPLVGGVGIFSSSMLTILLLHSFGTYMSETVMFFWLCSAFLIIIGVIDDKRELSARVRILIQALIALLLVLEGGTTVENLGPLLGNSDLSTGAFSQVFTLIAIVGLINAFNMVDGIDGLLAGLSIIGLCAIAALSLRVPQAHYLTINALIVTAALVPFFFFNLGVKKIKLPKVFLGDAGSMFLGLLLAWLLIHASQPSFEADVRVIQPTTALWLVAIPIFDLFSTVFRRLAIGRSPFVADRFHIHHILLHATQSNTKTLLLILLASVFAALVGIMLELWIESSALSFISFIVVFFAYCAYSICYIKKMG